MTWLPLKKLCFTGFKGAAMCQYRQYVCIVGGSLGQVYVMYDIEKNTADYISCSVSFHGLMDSGLCFCANHLILIGGVNNLGPTAAVHYALPGKSGWRTLPPLQCARASPTVLTCQKACFVVGGTNDVSERLVEYYDFGSKSCGRWTTIIIPNIPKEIQMHFFVFMGRLHALYFEKDDFVTLKYFLHESKWQAEQPVINGVELKQVSSVLSFPGCIKPFIVFSTSKDNIKVPNYVWYPELGQLSKLTHPKEKCLIPDCHSLQKVCCLMSDQSTVAPTLESEQEDAIRLHQCSRNERVFRQHSHHTDTPFIFDGINSMGMINVRQMCGEPEADHFVD